MSKRRQPVWVKPISKDRPSLKLFNSLTRQKEDFVPLDGNNVTWYSCGPTVYDASHMGHARSYISFDILRRVLKDYFGYNIIYVMNITDIDDKIIMRARQNYLYDRYVELAKSLPLEQLLNDQQEVLKAFELICAVNTDPDKVIMFTKTLDQMMNASIDLSNAIAGKKQEKIEKARENYLIQAKDPISKWLDQTKGSTVTENSIFETLPRYWENQFHKDMDALNIWPPDVLTRVSQYVPQIIAFIERIISNSMAYVSNGSVYFDVNRFDKSDNHSYAKLVPEAFGDIRSLEEGEGALSTGGEQSSEKRSPNDFALWKAGKKGEPVWDSPWGKGRPGWHIECSAMASDILGTKVDIHTGGVDLKFPHHDNELAQSEAAFDQEEWVKYFLHTGHLTITGCKMSKSLKNFITIQEALQTHTPCQLRFAFLLHSWKDTLDYSDKTMEMATQYERIFNEFFLNVKDLTRQNNDEIATHFDEWSTPEAGLQEKFNAAQDQVHSALCDNVDTRSALDSLRDLIGITNVYIRDNKKTNSFLLRRIALYITDILHIFGAIVGPRGGIGFPIETNVVDKESIVMPYANAIANFRHQVRSKAKDVQSNDILELCDKLRDDVLPPLGIRLEDKEDGQFAVKMVDPAVLQKMREAQKLAEAARLAEKNKQKAAIAAAALAKEQQKRINPKEMFLHEVEKYSTFDENGLPTHDTTGKEVSKSQLKKLQKLQMQQQQRYNEFIESMANAKI